MFSTLVRNCFWGLFNRLRDKDWLLSWSWKVFVFWHFNCLLPSVFKSNYNQIILPLISPLTAPFPPPGQIFSELQQLLAHSNVFHWNISLNLYYSLFDCKQISIFLFYFLLIFKLLLVVVIVACRKCYVDPWDQIPQFNVLQLSLNRKKDHFVAHFNELN